MRQQLRSLLVNSCQIVESYRDGDKVRQRILATLGRLEDLRESGQLDRLLASAERVNNFETPLT